ncbi:unnamed protein product [Eretmochelys imbricata]
MGLHGQISTWGKSGIAPLAPAIQMQAQDSQHQRYPPKTEATRLTPGTFCTRSLAYNSVMCFVAASHTTRALHPRGGCMSAGLRAWRLGSTLGILQHEGGTSIDPLPLEQRPSPPKHTMVVSMLPGAGIMPRARKRGQGIDR